jgi:steroid 5-alpha reductase family enzyme
MVKQNAHLCALDNGCQVVIVDGPPGIGCPVIAGVALNLVADGAFHRAGTTVKPFQESSALLTDGVYRYSRHPMYLGFVLILIGVAILLGSLTPWVVIPVFAVLMEVVFIRVEERMLAEKFGPAWLAYKKRCGVGYKTVGTCNLMREVLIEEASRRSKLVEDSQGEHPE